MALTDTEIRQMADDYSRRMVDAYARYQRTKDPADRREAVMWQEFSTAATRALSPVARVVREAEIQAAIERGAR